jgi:hypothetical protein
MNYPHKIEALLQYAQANRLWLQLRSERDERCYECGTLFPEKEPISPKDFRNKLDGIEKAKPRNNDDFQIYYNADNWDLVNPNYYLDILDRHLATRRTLTRSSRRGFPDDDAENFEELNRTAAYQARP